MNLLDLPEDVLFTILSLAEVSSVLAVSQANKYIRRIVYTPSVWLALVQDLRCRGFIDSHQFPSQKTATMTTSQLVALVRGLALGPDTWSTPSSSRTSSYISGLWKILTPTVEATGIAPARSLSRAPAHPSSIPDRVVVVSTGGPSRGSNTLKDALLLPGGAYVLFRVFDPPSLECWRVADDSLLWRYQDTTTEPGTLVLCYGVEVLPGGAKANLVLWLHTQVQAQQWHDSLEFINLDLITGRSDLVFKTSQFPFTLTMNQPLKVSGGLVALRVRRVGEREPLTLIVDCHGKRYCAIRCPDETLTWTLDLIPGYIIFTNTVPAGALTISVGAPAAFDSKYWHHLRIEGVEVEFTPELSNINLPFENFPRVASLTLPPEPDDDGPAIRPRQRTTLAVIESPLSLGQYRVWVSFRHSKSVGRGHAALSSFTLTVPPLFAVGASAASSQVILRLRSSQALNIEVAAYYTTIAYSGHTHLIHNGRHCVVEPPMRGVPLSAIELRMDAQYHGDVMNGSEHLMPYGGLMFSLSMRSNVVLRYFR